MLFHAFAGLPVTQLSGVYSSTVFVIFFAFFAPFRGH